jgi:phosphoribosylaminoimidazole-succinocarboxamide synthase
MNKKLEKLYEGKAKILYQTENYEQLIQYFKDDATAFNNVKKDVISKKGILNNYISEFLMKKLSENSIDNHFIKRISDREQLIKAVNIIPLEIIIRNVTAGSMAKRLGIKEGLQLEKPIFEICYKDDSLGDPLICDSHAITVLKIIKEQELQDIKKTSFKINEILLALFDEIGIKLVDFKLEFGHDFRGKIILADEISPDSCRLWDKKSGEKLDKDIFRRDLGDLVTGYEKVAKALGVEPS